jgi:SAM-dependent MidA family methyltransferase
MEQALFHPTTGYYSRQIRAIGRRGDFTTVPRSSSLLAQAIARWAKKLSSSLSIHHLIELGPGDASLARDLLRALGPIARSRLQLHLVERSPTLSATQAKALPLARSWPRPVLHHNSIHHALDAAAGRALIFSNELADAFPVHRLVWDKHAHAWREIHLAHHRDALREVFVTPAPRLLATPSSQLDPASWPGGAPPHGQRIELATPYLDWLSSWLPQLRAGALLTIDYGDTFPNIYHRRPGGTLRAYHHHQRLEGAAIYHRPGRQDITADINFSDLIAHGQAHQLSPAGGHLTTLGAFLAAQDLDPTPIAEAATAFKVLHQSPLSPTAPHPNPPGS